MAKTSPKKASPVVTRRSPIKKQSPQKPSSNKKARPAKIATKQLEEDDHSQVSLHEVESKGESPDGNDPLNPVRVYADGVFDMYHIGHAKVLEQAKKLFKHVHLIVGVSGDTETIAKKGKIVMSEKERCDILRHCRWVDEIICPCPWVIKIPFLLENNIHYVAHDDLPYGSVGQEDIYAEIKRHGMFKATQRTEGISTSDIILRIIRDYDLYVTRSFERGYAQKDIGVSRTRAMRIKMRNKFTKWMGDIEKKEEKLGVKFDETYGKLRDQIFTFIDKYDPDAAQKSYVDNYDLGTMFQRAGLTFDTPKLLPKDDSDVSDFDY